MIKWAIPLLAVLIFLIGIISFILMYNQRSVLQQQFTSSGQEQTAK